MTLPRITQTVLGWIAAAALVGVGVLIFGFTPHDALMGPVQKIMYVHVPSVWVAYVAVFLLFAASIVYLWKRQPAADRVGRAAAELGMLFCGLGLITGSLWGRPTWGTYWVWDARLTSTLLLFLILVGYNLLRAYAPPGERQGRIAAVLGIVAALDVPLIHLSVQWWRTLHQTSSVFKVGETGAPKTAMPPELLLPLFLGLAAATIFFAFLMVYRVRVLVREELLAERLAEEGQ